jgi:hypothetical protein
VVGVNDRTWEARCGQAMAELLHRSHLMGPGELAGHLTEVARPLGTAEIRVYLADLQQSQLREASDGAGWPPRSLGIDSTLPGRVFQTYTIRWAQEETPDGEHRLWLPLVDGTERLGVMEVTLVPGAEDDEPAVTEWCRRLADLAGLIIASKSTYSDTYAAVQRRREMAVEAEMVWAFLAPRTFATDRVILTAILEPAYEVGGDAFDHSLFGDHLHVAVFDSVGHDLTAGLISSVAIAACRAARRMGGSLADIAARIDRSIHGQFGESRFATALLCDLDTVSGLFSWIPCGHPAPLLLRDGKVVKQLTREPRLPLGLLEETFGGRDPAATTYAERLQPGDRLLLYTDGVVEGRGAGGREFGLERLGDFVNRHSAEGLPAPETLRRLNQAIVDYQHGRLRDDSTVVLLEWLPSDPERQLTA